MAEERPNDTPPNAPSSENCVQFVVVAGPSKGERIVLTQRTALVVGRSSSAHFQLPEHDKRCSRLHFVIEFRPEDGVLRVVDLGSRNGILINKEKVWQSEVTSGDVLQAGPVAFKVRFVGSPFAPYDSGSESVAFHQLDREREQKRSQRAKSGSAESKTRRKKSKKSVARPEIPETPAASKQPAAASRPKAFDPMEALSDGPLIAADSSDEISVHPHRPEQDQIDAGKTLHLTKSAARDAISKSEPLITVAPAALVPGMPAVINKPVVIAASNEPDFTLDEFEAAAPDKPLSWDDQAPSPGVGKRSAEDEGFQFDIDFDSGISSVEGELPAPMVESFPEIPGFAIESVLGKGTIGSTYRARRERDGMVCAVKVIRPAKESEGNPALAKFVDDAESLLDIQHSNIVRYRDIERGPGCVFIVSDFHEGIDGQTWMREKGALSVGHCCKLFYGVLLALDYARESGISHRDIKPSNLLITNQGSREVCMLTDFGLQLVYNNSTLATVKQKIDLEGVIRFTAPEFINNFRENSIAADIYSVGATMYYMLTGKYIHDFDTMSFDQSVTKIKRDDAISIHQRKAEIPVELGNVIHAAIQRFPTRRLSDVNAFRKEVAKFIR
jgi:pSer/pThr/pTyr-binding forkhead associated (FHA) protein